ncbi:MAG: hypothetical protein CMJ79_08015 [Planctomycetaceae bacterium]|nr:hypothetical protein [Planctomycetaceae bacterium]|tara:strand:- start:1127 stop:2224 length:1098 start_codon:yes stop_codon:yes gene_type:complete
MKNALNIDKATKLWQHLNGWHEKHGVRAVAAEIGTIDGPAETFTAGFDDFDQKIAVDENSTFLIASPTKPFVTTAIMQLVEQGELTVSDLVSKYLPEFTGGGKESIRLAHLLTHTSGLPDMLPNNTELRKRHAPLSEYQSYVNEVELVYAPGTRVHYQSMGILTLSTIIEQISGVTTAEFLKSSIFKPLGMSQTSLGASAELLASNRPPVASMVEQIDGHDLWGWNSDYWRSLGAPWGGLISSAKDLGIFCQSLLKILGGDAGIVAPSTLRAMTSNQLRGFRKLRAGTADALPWGYGWQLNWPNHPRGFGSVLPQEAFGHWGATGTLVWIDPSESVYGLVLTNEPMELENRRQISFANMSRLVWD